MDRQAAEVIVLAQLAAWTLHPGYLREGAKAPSLEQCWQLTQQILEIIYGRNSSGR